MIFTRDSASTVVFNLQTPVAGGNKMVGTGIFVHKNDNDIFLVTASHVARDTNQNSVVALCGQNNSCIVVPLFKYNKNLSWNYHPVADIASLKVELNPEIAPFIVGRFLPLNHFNLTAQCVSRDCELTAIGFPNGLGVQGKFSPLTFRSYASSSFLTLLRADTKTPSDFFCLENPSVGGYSGGPVFDLGYMIVGAMTTTKDKTVCHGIMHGTMLDDTGGKIALVTPAHYLPEIL